MYHWLAKWYMFMLIYVCLCPSSWSISPICILSPLLCTYLVTFAPLACASLCGYARLASLILCSICRVSSYWVGTLIPIHICRVTDSCMLHPLHVYLCSYMCNSHYHALMHLCFYMLLMRLAEPLFYGLIWSTCLIFSLFFIPLPTLFAFTQFMCMPLYMPA